MEQVTENFNEYQRNQHKLVQLLIARYGQDKVMEHKHSSDITLLLDAKSLYRELMFLHEDSFFDFKCLIDICGMDYFSWQQGTPGLFSGDAMHGSGVASTATEDIAESSFDQMFGKLSKSEQAAAINHPDHTEAVDLESESSTQPQQENNHPHRFAVVYHLLSLRNNHRLRVRVYLVNEKFPQIESVNDIWAAANWFEREAFDLYGIVFINHPDLRRLLTDYGFIGFPFRKDFPVEGHVEMRYDPINRRVIYQPVTIEHREVVPRIVRDDSDVIPAPAGAQKAT